MCPYYTMDATAAEMIVALTPCPYIYIYKYRYISAVDLLDTNVIVQFNRTKYTFQTPAVGVQTFITGLNDRRSDYAECQKEHIIYITL